MLSTALVVVVLAGAWTLWDHHRHGDVDEELEAREARFGKRVVLAWAGTLAVLLLALVLEGAGVHSAGWLALAAVAGLMALFYVVPLFGPRRSKPPGRR